MQAYEQLEAHYRRLGNIRDASGILNWDSSVIMPKGAAHARGEQLATLSGIAHEMETDPKIADLLEKARQQPQLDDWQRANLREIERRYHQATALSQDLVEAMTRATNKCEMIWREARPANDFASLEPALAEVVDLVRQTAQALADKSGLEPYDAMLDQFQPGLTASDIDPLFDALARQLPERIDAAIELQDAPLHPQGPFPKAMQKSIGERLMGELGFDFDKGRLDESAHPFSGGATSDHRITTRYDENEVVTGLMAVLHETGHALYEAGLPHDIHAHQPVAEARGMALHESQSLFVEMQLCRSDAFIFRLATLLKQAFGDDPAFEPANLRKIYRTVRRGLIRVDADELTYPLHIILRYRLEREILRGKLEVRDLPEAWNEGMAGLLGITPTDDRDGVMQDIHWQVGAFGYFPSYTLGALIAAQLFEAAERDLGDIDALIESGEFHHVVNWLKRNVHQMGSSLTMPELIVQSSGSALGETAFLRHVTERYSR